MKILLLTSVAETLDAFFPDWVRTWSKSHTVVTASSGSPHSDMEHIEIPHLTQAPSVTSSLPALRALRQAIRHSDPDVVVSNTATASALVRVLPTVPIVYFCHGLHWDRPNVSNLPIRALEAALTRSTAGVITINSDDRKWFARRIPPARHLHLDAGVGLNLAYWREAIIPAPRLHDLELLWVGALEPRKRPQLAIQVVHELLRSGHDAHLTMLGEGSMRGQLSEQAGSCGPDRITMPGRRDPRPHLFSADVLLHTAAWEGLPRALLEATAAGTPAVAANAKGSRDVPFVTLAPGTPSALASAVLRVIERRPIELSLSADFESTLVAQKALDFIENVAARNRAPGLS